MYNSYFGSIIVFLLTFFSTSSISAATIRDLNDDWRDVSNPNGVWTYRGPFGVLPQMGAAAAGYD